MEIEAATRIAAAAAATGGVHQDNTIHIKHGDFTYKSESCQEAMATPRRVSTGLGGPSWRRNRTWLENV